MQIQIQNFLLRFEALRNDRIQGQNSPTFSRKISLCSPAFRNKAALPGRSPTGLVDLSVQRYKKLALDQQRREKRPLEEERIKKDRENEGKAHSRKKFKGLKGLEGVRQRAGSLRFLEDLSKLNQKAISKSPVQPLPGGLRKQAILKNQKNYRLSKQGSSPRFSYSVKDFSNRQLCEGFDHLACNFNDFSNTFKYKGGDWRENHDGPQIRVQHEPIEPRVNEGCSNDGRTARRILFDNRKYRLSCAADNSRPSRRLSAIPVVDSPDMEKVKNMLYEGKKKGQATSPKARQKMNKDKAISKFALHIREIDWQKMNRVFSDRERFSRRTRATVFVEPIDFGDEGPTEIAKLAARFCGEEGGFTGDERSLRRKQLLDFALSEPLLGECAFRKIEEVGAFLNCQDKAWNSDCLYSPVLMSKVDGWLENGFEPGDEEEALALGRKGLFHGSVVQLLGPQDPSAALLVFFNNIASEIQREHYRMIVDLK